jgi:hypothetical protein
MKVRIVPRCATVSWTCKFAVAGSDHMESSMQNVVLAKSKAVKLVSCFWTSTSIPTRFMSW